MAHRATELPGRSFEAAVAAAVAAFGLTVQPKLLAATSHREDQLRGPLEELLRKVGTSLRLEIIPVGEQELPDRSRPDYLIKASGVAVGHVEIKAPGRGSDPSQWPAKSHDRLQWERIKVLPNLLYTDGQQWALYHAGQRSGDIITLAGGDLLKAGPKLVPSDIRFAQMLHEFIHWEPAVPRSLRQLVRAVSGLCSLLRADVSDRLHKERRGETTEWFIRLASDWRRLLFPGASDETFADQYAQTVTFALLLARVEGIEFAGRSPTDIAKQLGKKHSLMGKALSLLTEDVTSELNYVLESMLRVIGVVDWSRLDDGTGDSYLYLYERFLEQYDPVLRRKTGSYYTPREVTSFMIRFTEQIVQRRLEIQKGYASEQVVIVDPAMGTGTFLLNIIDSVARSVSQDGKGNVPEQLRALTRRLIGFEKQTGPYAVAELRTYQALMNKYQTEPPTAGLRYYVTDTLDDPYQEPDSLGNTYEPIARSLRLASKVKREEPVMVVIGNPPYHEHARELGKWIVNGTQSSAIASMSHWLDDQAGSGQPITTDLPPLDAFIPPSVRASAGAHLKHLHNLYIYFWRWATWKVFEAHPRAPTGIVAFITTSAYLTGPGFVGMREYLRKTADEGWIIDLSPEGHQPKVSTRIFPEVQHPLCIGIFLRKSDQQHAGPAPIKYISVGGTRKEKFAQLKELDPDSDDWSACSTGWQDPFHPPPDVTWATFPGLRDVMHFASPGIKANRTWVRSPSEDILRDRWSRLVKADPLAQPKLFKESRDANLDSTPESITRPGSRLPPFRREPGLHPAIRKYAARSFDLQYIIADPRVLNDPRQDLWRIHGPRQLYITELHNQPLSSGPGITFAAFVPDMHHYKGNGGGRVFPLYQDAEGQLSNVSENLVTYLSQQFASSVTPEDFVAYLAGIIAHPGYTTYFEKSLKTPGVRFPLTASVQLWDEAVRLGREVIWLHTRGERFCDPASNRPSLPPRMSEGERPKLERSIAPSVDAMPESIFYDATTRILHVGVGEVQPVSPEVWAYNVNGMPVVRKWFSYRKKDPAGKRSSPLDDVNPEIWLPSYSTDLLDLLNVLGRLVALEPSQHDLLHLICAGQMLAVGTLSSAGALITLDNRYKRRKRYLPPFDQLSFDDLD